MVGGYRDGEGGVPSPSVEVVAPGAAGVETLYEARRGFGGWGWGWGCDWGMGVWGCGVGLAAGWGLGTGVAAGGWGALETPNACALRLGNKLHQP